MILEIVEIEKYVLSSSYHLMGRTPEERRAIARTFVAKAVYDLPTTRIIIEMLHAMPNLCMICGFIKKGDIPSEATFSHAFAEFAHTGLGNKVHDVLVNTTLSDQLIGHIAWDATAIVGNEKPLKKEKSDAKPKKRGRPKKGEAPKLKK